MKKNEFSLFLSQKDGTEASREISLKIKSTFHRTLNFIFVLFTPNYRPQTLLERFNLTLPASNLLGVKSPFLIYKNKIIKKGVVACCINKKEAKFTNFPIEAKNSEKIERRLRLDFKSFKKQDINFISFLSPQVSPVSFLEALRLFFSKTINFSGAGYENKNYSTPYFILKKNLEDNLINLNTQGIKTHTTYFHNFVPLGKPFTITKLNFQQQIIHEINEHPAVEIYKNYFQEKFTSFVKNRLFRYYPLGIPSGNYFRLLTIADILEDGSFVFRGTLRHKAKANIMILTAKHSQGSLINQLEKINTDKEGLVFIVNSLTRKKNLGKNALEEIKNIQKVFFPKKEVFGLFSDYYFFADHKTQEVNVESGGLLVNVWE